MFQCVIDQLIGSLTEWFSTNMHIIADIQYLIPKNFNNQSYPENCLNILSDLIGINRQKVISELQAFSNIYENIVGSLNKRTINHIYKNSEVDINSDNGNEDDDNDDDDYLDTNEDDFNSNRNYEVGYKVNEQHNSKQIPKYQKVLFTIIYFFVYI